MSYGQKVEVEDIELAFARVLFAVFLWGIQLWITGHACTLLLRRQLRSSIAGQWQLALVIVMFFLSCGHMIGLLHKEISRSEPFSWYFSCAFISTIMFAVSDFVVVWRAWVIWRDRFVVKSALAAVSFVVFGCVAPSLYVQAARYGSGQLDIPMWVTVVLSFVPFVSSNLVATGLVAYKAWLYRFEIYELPGPGGTTPGRSAKRLGFMFLLFIEGGFAYSVLWVVYMASFLAPRVSVVTHDASTDAMLSANPSAYRFFEMWEIMMIEVAAMYPAVIVILVSKLITQSDVIYGTYSGSSETRPRASLAPVHEQLVGESSMASMRFALPVLSSTTKYGKKESLGDECTLKDAEVGVVQSQ